MRMASTRISTRGRAETRWLAGMFWERLHHTPNHSNGQDQGSGDPGYGQQRSNPASANYGGRYGGMTGIVFGTCVVKTRSGGVGAEIVHEMAM